MKILIVDDESEVADFLKNAAKTRGITDIDTAACGEEALGQVVRQHYDLITLDIRMPGVSGLEILSIMRNMCPHAVIIVISGYIPAGIDEETTAAADALIAKPIHLNLFAQLVDATQQIIAARETIQSLCSEWIPEELSQPLRIFPK